MPILQFYLMTYGTEQVQYVQKPNRQTQETKLLFTKNKTAPLFHVRAHDPNISRP